MLCPAIAKINWRREFAKWQTMERELLVFSYDKMTQSKEVRNEIAKLAPDVLILDEAHYLKNRQAKRTRLVYGQYCRGDGLVRFADRIWLLSGTPIPNDVSDFWTHLKAIWKYPLTYADYTLYFCKTWNGQFGLKVLGNKAERMQEFKDILRGIMKRRRTEAVLKELPPLFWQESLIEVDGWQDMRHVEDPAERAAIELILRNAVVEDDLSDKIESIAPHLAQIRRLTGIAKAKPIAQQVATELRDNAYDKVIIFAHHRAVMETLRDELAEFNPAYVVGGMGKEKQDEIDRFQTDPECRVFLGQILSCSTAITLTAATNVVFAELDWVPATNAQAAKRAHRIGQTKPVIVRTFGLAGSVDEIVSRTLVRKSRMISEALD